MARKPLRSQLNQIRAWVQQGRTDAWIAHQLEVSTAELREFRQRHELSADAGTDEIDLRDEIEAEIEAAMDAEDEEEPEAEEEPEGDEAEEEGDEGEGEGDDDSAPKRRRRRRGGRGRGRARQALQATFQHGEPDGYGLWMDPAVTDDPVYTEHWADQREVEVSIQQDQIVIRRAG